MGNTLEHLKKGDLEVKRVLKMIKTLGRVWMSLKNRPAFMSLYVGLSNRL